MVGEGSENTLNTDTVNVAIGGEVSPVVAVLWKLCKAVREVSGVEGRVNGRGRRPVGRREGAEEGRGGSGRLMEMGKRRKNEKGM